MRHAFATWTLEGPISMDLRAPVPVCSVCREEIASDEC
jgi:hypothetical protein